MSVLPHALSLSHSFPAPRASRRRVSLVCVACAQVGDHVVVVNAAYVVVPQNALDTKKYYSHSGWMGGLKTKPLWRLFEDNPTEPLRRAIFGMMPRNKLRYQRMTRLRLYPTAEHTHESQFRAAGAKAFRALPTCDSSRQPGTMQLERIQPALATGNIE